MADPYQIPVSDVTSENVIWIYDATANGGAGGFRPLAVTDLAAGTSTNGVTSFQQTATASAAALPSATFANGIVLTAPSTNTSTIYVGGSSVTASGANAGYPLKAGQSISYGVANSNQIYMVGTNTTDVLVGTGN